MAENFTPARAGWSRVFLIRHRAGPTRRPSYESCIKAMGVAWGAGDTERIECQDPDRYGEMIDMGEVQTSKERPSTSLVGRLAADQKSLLLELTRARCSFDLQVHLGECKDPRVFNSFDKALIYESGRISNYSTEDVGALATEEKGKVDETADLSAEDYYEVLPLSVSPRADDIITNALLDGVVCDPIACGECGDPSVGCEKVYYVTEAAGGSAGTPPDIVFTVDKGTTWYAHDIDTLGAAEDPSGVACLKEYVVVVSAASDSLHYATRADITPTNDEAWTENATGFLAAGSPNDIWSFGSFAFVVGEGGYVYTLEDPTAGVTVIDAGIATSLQLRAVHGLSRNFAIAVGDSGSIIRIEDETSVYAVTPTNVLFTQNWEAVWVKSRDHWWIVGATPAGVGQVWYTLDGGSTFYRKGNDGYPGIPGTYTDFQDIQFQSDSVGLLVGMVAGPRARVLRTFDGGHSWTIVPEDVGTLPLMDRLNALATCREDPNFMTAGGLGDNGTDGALVVGAD